MMWRYWSIIANLTFFAMPQSPNFSLFPFFAQASEGKIIRKIGRIKVSKTLCSACDFFSFLFSFPFFPPRLWVKFYLNNIFSDPISWITLLTRCFCREGFLKRKQTSQWKLFLAATQCELLELLASVNEDLGWKLRRFILPFWRTVCKVS